MRGRKSKLTPERQGKIVTFLENGHYKATACLLAGIHIDTFFTWLVKGEQRPDSNYALFADAVKRAEAIAEERALERVRKGAEGGEVVTRKTTITSKGNTIIEETFTRPEWQAAAWLLERKMPDKWGRRERHEMTGKDGGPIRIEHERDLSLLNMEELDNLKALVIKASNNRRN